MNKILVEVSVGELLDKISILEIKKGKIKDLEKLEFINNEHGILNDQLDQNVKSDDKLNNLFQSLKEINAKLWIIEDDKRLCEKNSDFTENFIRIFYPLKQILVCGQALKQLYQQIYQKKSLIKIQSLIDLIIN